MTRYLISFGVHAMDHIPAEDMPAVGKAAHAVVQEAVNAGVLVCTGGLEDRSRPRTRRDAPPGRQVTVTSTCPSLTVAGHRRIH